WGRAGGMVSGRRCGVDCRRSASHPPRAAHMPRTRSRPPQGSRPSSLSVRLLVPLVLAVGGVMAAFAAWALLQRERTLVAEARRETQAFGTALGLAFEAAFADPDRA